MLLSGFAGGRRCGGSRRGGRRRGGDVAVERECVQATLARASRKNGNVLLAVEHVRNRVRESRRKLHAPELFTFVCAERFELSGVGSREDQIAGRGHRAT